MVCIKCSNKNIYCKNMCKKCYHLDYSIKNSDKIKIKNQKWHKEKFKYTPEIKKYQQQWQKDNNKKVNKYSRDSYIKFRDKKLEYKKQYYQIPEIKNKKRIYCNNYHKNRRKNDIDFKNKCRLSSKLYSQKNKEKLKEIRNTDEFRNKKRIYCNKRRKINFDYKLICNLRSRNNAAFKGLIKEQTCLQSLGCSPEFFRNYIINKFEPWMTVENYGTKWVIDHDISISSGKTVKEKHKLNHYTNLQPMEKYENLYKGASLNWRKR